LRVEDSSGWPDERKTSCTIRGATDGGDAPGIRAGISFASRHDEHSPEMLAGPPHAQLRCNRREESGAQVNPRVWVAFFEVALASEVADCSAVLKPIRQPPPR
jgi:hypothetical protein